MTGTDMVQEAAPKRPTSRWVAGLVLAALFVTGLVAGVTLDRLVLHHQHGPFAGMRPGPGWVGQHPERRAEMQRRLAKRISDELDLTPEQRSQVEAILPRREAGFDSLRVEMDTRLKVLLDSASAEVERLLTPEQRVKWTALRQRFPGPGGPTGPGR